MRELRDLELDLILGGTTEVDPVVVTGEEDDYEPDDEPEDDGEEWNEDDYDDNGDGDDDPPNDPPLSPEIIAQAHEKVLAWTNQYKSSPNEYVSLIYVLNGQVFTTEARTINAAGEAPTLDPDQEVPEGGVVIGFIHNHPDEEGEPGDAYPSTGMEINGQVTGDWAYVDYLFNGALWGSFEEGQGWTGETEIDSNMLTYIVTSEGAFEFTIDDYQTMQETAGEEVVPEETTP